MNVTKRPISIWILSCLYIAVGTIAFVYYFPELIAQHEQGMLIELTELLAIVSGIFMLGGRNWARWLALAWMVFHVVISFPVIRQFVSHLIILAVIVWVLFLSNTRHYFGPVNGDYE